MTLGAAQILALTIAYESANQGNIGMESVASVIWNRAEHKTPMEFAMLCLEPRQFSCWNGHNPNQADINYWHGSGQPNMEAYRRALEIAISMVYGTFKPTLAAKYYARFDCKKAWMDNVQMVCRIGEHIFYQDKEV